MRVAKDDVEEKLVLPGAVIRQHKDFGEMHGYGKLSAEYFTLVKGSTRPRFSMGSKATVANARIGVSC